MFQDNKIFVICELSQTHEGNFELGKKLVRAAADAGADAAKVQVFTADELAVPTYQYYELFKKLEWSESQWKELVDYGHSLGIKVLADIFGVDSVKMLLRTGIDGFKIHTTDMRNPRLLKFLAQTDLPLILSVGGGMIEETREALKMLNADLRKIPVLLMQGFQSYPTLVEYTNLGKMKYFHDQLLLPVGFADHIAGDHRMNFALCAAAVGMGARVIEKHITIDRALKMEDYESALDPSGFVDFVSKIRELEAALGQENDQLIPVEQNYRKAVRKHVVAARLISKGGNIRDEDVLLKRSGVETREASDLLRVIGKRAQREYSVNDVIVLEDLV